MSLEEAKNLAQQGVKVTHDSFTSDEWLIMQGNMIKFEDGVQIFFKEWTENRPYLLQGWSIWSKK